MTERHFSSWNDYQKLFSWLIDLVAHCIKYAKIRFFTDPYSAVQGHWEPVFLHNLCTGGAQAGIIAAEYTNECKCIK